MNRKIHKFERMVKFQNNKLDILKQQMASANSKINSLNVEHEKLVTLLQETARQNLAVQTIAILQQIELAMCEIQKQINHNRTELAAAAQAFKMLRDAYLAQDRKLKSWEKLVEQETEKQISANNRTEIKQADETYLITRFGRELR
ncbi:MAG: flagellar FliJ family protein [Pirellulaceae bacterium]